MPETENIKGKQESKNSRMDGRSYEIFNKIPETNVQKATPNKEPKKPKK